MLHSSLRRPLLISGAVVLLVALVMRQSEAATATATDGERRDYAPNAGRVARQPAPTSGVRGHVYGDIGGVENARVCLSAYSLRPESSDGMRCANTASDGSYALADVVSGLYGISAVARGYVLQMNARELRLLGDSVEQVDFRLTRDGVFVRGSVLDATGGVVANARVQLTLTGERERFVSEAESSAEGAFEMLVPPGPILVSASAEGYAMASALVIAPAENVGLRLVPGATIRGFALDARTRETLANVSVRASAQHSIRRSRGARSAMTTGSSCWRA